MILDQAHNKGIEKYISLNLRISHHGIIGITIM